MKALIACNDEALAWALPALLARAGFIVDVVSRSGIFTRSAFVRRIFLVPNHSSIVSCLAEAMQDAKEEYDWVIPTEDRLLAEIRDADIPPTLKLKMAPVLSERNFPHLYSKTGLARTLEEHRIPAPRFRIAHSLPEALCAADALGYPVMLKIDESSGGDGVFECRTACDLRRRRKIFDGKPLLLQEKITGVELDLSALYRDGKLIHFHYAFPRRCAGRFGPSLLRDYFPMRSAGREIVMELEQLGAALGAHGFVTISCIENGNHKRHYIEADMRPNTWVDYPTFFGDDPAPYIRDWFGRKAHLTAGAFGAKDISRPPFRVPYILRLNHLELIINRHGAWRFIPPWDRTLAFHVLIRRFFSHYLFRLGRHLMPKKYRGHARRLAWRAGLY